MTPKQMYRAMRKHGISVVFDKAELVWLAGDHEPNAEHDFLVNCVNQTVPRKDGLLTVHSGSTPEMAVEDYCNARNLEWDA